MLSTRFPFSVTVMTSVIRGLRDRVLRLQKEATGIRAVAMSLSFDEDRDLFLQHAAALDAEAARLEVQARQDELREEAHLGLSVSASQSQR